MFLAKVEGTLVATKKDPSMNGRKLLLVRPQLVDEKDPTKFRPGQNTIVAVDSVGCGEGELVPQGCPRGRRHHRHRGQRGRVRKTDF